MKKSKPPSHDDWMAALNDLGWGAPIQDNPSALSVAQLGELWGYGPSQTRLRILKLIKLGRAKQIHVVRDSHHLSAYILVK